MQQIYKKKKHNYALQRKSHEASLPKVSVIHQQETKVAGKCQWKMKNLKENVMTYCRWSNQVFHHKSAPTMKYSMVDKSAGTANTQLDINPGTMPERVIPVTKNSEKRSSVGRGTVREGWESWEYSLPPCKMMIPKLRSQHTLAGICKACYALYATAWTMTFKSPIFQQGFKTIDDGFSLTGFLLPWGHKQKSNQFKYLSTCGSMWASMHSVCGGMPWGWNLVCDRSL